MGLIAVPRTSRLLSPKEMDVWRKERTLPPDAGERVLRAQLSEPCPCRMCTERVLVRRNRAQIKNMWRDLQQNKLKRALVFARDGNRCVVCGTRDNLTIDHLISLAKGGSNAYHNLQAMCARCNNYKSRTEDLEPL